MIKYQITIKARQKVAQIRCIYTLVLASNGSLARYMSNSKFSKNQIIKFYGEIRISIAYSSPRLQPAHTFTNRWTICIAQTSKLNPIKSDVQINQRPQKIETFTKPKTPSTPVGTGGRCRPSVRRRSPGTKPPGSAAPSPSELCPSQRWPYLLHRRPAGQKWKRRERRRRRRSARSPPELGFRYPAKSESGLEKKVHSFGSGWASAGSLYTFGF